MIGHILYFNNLIHKRKVKHIEELRSNVNFFILIIIQINFH
jgi:hypothetical protein